MKGKRSKLQNLKMKILLDSRFLMKVQNKLNKNKFKIKNLNNIYTAFYKNYLKQFIWEEFLNICIRKQESTNFLYKI